MTAAQFEQARGIAPIVCVQNHYNLANRQDDAMIDALSASGTAQPVASTFLREHPRYHLASWRCEINKPEEKQA